MKIRPSLLWFSLAVFAIVASIIWQTKKPNKLVTGAETPAPVEAAPVAQPVTNAPVQSAGPAPAAAIPPPNAATVPQKSQEEITRERFATENDVPIVFYGKLEDHFGKPVAAAEIIGNTIINNGAPSIHPARAFSAS